MAAEGGAPAAKVEKAKPAVEKVKMLADGREVDFVGKRKMLKEPIIDGDRVGVRLDFRNGESREFIIPAELMAQFAAHGAAQKLGDETAGEDDIDDMVLAVDDLAERLTKGEWKIAREGGGMAGTSVLLKALVEHTSKPVEDLKAWLKGKTQQEKLALRNSKAIKPIVERIEAEKAASGAKVDTDALLGELQAA